METNVGRHHRDHYRRPLTPKYLSAVTRFLFKVGLEFIHKDAGAVEAFASKYDEVRRIALGARYHGYLLAGTHGAAHEQVRTTVWPGLLVDGNETVWVELDVFGIRFATDLMRRQGPPHQLIGATLLRF